MSLFRTRMINQGFTFTLTCIQGIVSKKGHDSGFSELHHLKKGHSLKVYKFLFILLLFSSMFAQRAYRQIYYQPYLKEKIPHKMPVLIRAYPVYLGDGRFRIYLPVEIQYDFLQFLFKEGVYQAGAEIEVIFKKPKSEVLSSKLWKIFVQTSTFDSTNRRDLFHFTLDSLEASSGRYQVLVKYRDLNAGKRLDLNFKIILPLVKDSYFSPPLFVYPDIPARGLTRIFRYQPSALRQHWEFNRDLGLLLQGWVADSIAEIPLRLSIYDDINEKALFTLDTIMTGAGKKKWVYLLLPTHLLPEGHHQLKVVYRIGEDSIRQRLPLIIIWFFRPTSLWDRKMAFDVLQYIMDREEFEQFQKGNRDERLKKFDAFWKQRDPNPETPYNELLKEFYTRVDSANARWSLKRVLGWKTDVGRIYILYGPPDEVDDHSLDPGPNPYLRWVYFQDGQRVIFTFQALEGRKEYKLTRVEELPLQ